MPSAPPLVSVIIGVRNGEQHVHRTLAAALEQSMKELEIVVVDDGSTDATASIIDGVAERDPRIRLLRRPPTGVAAARNLAVEEARAELVAILDADDLWHPGKLEAQVTALRTGGPDVAAVGCLPTTIDLDDGIVAALVPFSARTTRDLNGYALMSTLVAAAPWCGSMPLIRRGSFLEIGGYDAALPVSEDFDLATRLAERYPLAVVPRFLVGYRQHPQSRSTDAGANIATDLNIIDSVARRNPWIPGSVLRRARAGRHVFAAARCLTQGNPVGAVRHGAQAMLHDPAVLLQPEVFPAALALVTGRRSTRGASPMLFPNDLDQFLIDHPVDTSPGHWLFEKLDWRRHVRMRQLETNHRRGTIRSPGGI